MNEYEDEDFTEQQQRAVYDALRDSEYEKEYDEWLEGLAKRGSNSKCFEKLKNSLNKNLDVQFYENKDSINSSYKEYSEEKALRYNEGKPQYSLLSLEALEPLVRVLEFGANKYARNNWKKGQNLSALIDSTMRHLARILEGEMVDEESGLSHLGHAMCNLMFACHKNTKNDL